VIVSGVYNKGGRTNQREDREQVIRIQLPTAEADRLEQAFRHETDPKFRDRLQIVRLANRGRPHQDIAQDLATTPRSVQRWLNAFCDRGLEGLRPRKAKGAAAKIPNALADDIRGWVIAGPAQQGLDRANWTHAELADHLFKTRGIQTSRSALPDCSGRSQSALTKPNGPAEAHKNEGE